MRDKFAGSLVALLEEQFSAGLPLVARIQNAIRRQVISGALKKRDRLPSSRTLAGELAIARDTVEAAYQHLESEGFLTRIRGSGTFVADAGPDFVFEKPSRTTKVVRKIAIADRGELALRLGGVRDPGVRAFAAAMPDIRAFPLATWNRVASRVGRQHGTIALNYCDAQGYGPLREQIARYLAAHRGVRCAPDNIVVLTSSQQALTMVATLLLEPGDVVAVEDPGYPGIKSALRLAGAKLLPVGLDESGLRVDVLARLRSPLRGIYVTPSHQYPTGVTLSLERRLALIKWARSNKAWIIEDDYDSEYRYEGSPISCIQGIDTSGCVLYVGTFTKTLFPGLRLAYLVVPSHLVNAFVTARTLMDGHSAYLNQAILAEFMADGHFTAHIRRMRQLYQGRRDAFLNSFQRHLSSFAEAGAANGGFQIACQLKDRIDEAESIRIAAATGIQLPSLRDLYLGPKGKSGWVMGYVALAPQEAEVAMTKLKRALTERYSIQR